MELEDRLGALLGESVRELPVPVAVIVAESTQRGRRHRSRRRVVQLTGAALAMAGLVWVSSSIDLRRPPADPAVSAAGENVLGTLAELLPSGADLREVAGPAGTDQGLTVRYDNGLTPVTLTVELTPGPGCPEGLDCQTTRYSDGTTETVERLTDGYRVRAHRPGGTEVQLTVRPCADALPLWRQIAASPRWGATVPLH
ncbi:hypothetical protein CFP65_1813 [Kitasatospora sp. MMS16-BH015]|uniref:hypothetical protein n=1 Tax=Kitasatospora sp. MMS16-BH015 TaxID=2018025 RepID=UPI000CA389C3|nr:hypothetical protein [Kitasatospora sp. MMS16-BH015]AUG76687.1 hypothetical protein CFP65_1813 [Kitasatospora sp. MMS16-BH015]